MYTYIICIFQENFSNKKNDVVLIRASQKKKIIIILFLMIKEISIDRYRDK